MGVFTPNIGLFIPAAGETNYSDAFAAGMMNLDTHDHSGGPNKGLPISSTGLGDHSVTYEKLASNVADITTGIGVNNSSGLQYQLQMLGVLKNLFTFASTGGGTGIIAVNGSTVFGRTFQDSSSIVWTYPDGVSGNPSASITGVDATRPAFNAIAATQNNVTGDGTVYQVLFSTTSFDQDSNFNTGTSQFLVPTTGIYSIGAFLNLNSTIYVSSRIDIYINGAFGYELFYLNGIYLSGAANTALISLNSGDLVDIRLTATIAGSTKTLSVLDGYFTGILET